jgi:hypothetical protein
MWRRSFSLLIGQTHRVPFHLQAFTKKSRCVIKFRLALGTLALLARVSWNSFHIACSSKMRCSAVHNWNTRSIKFLLICLSMLFLIAKYMGEK